MLTEFIEMLRCPETGSALTLTDATYVGERVREGWLVNADGSRKYPVREFIPRFVDATNYADNFGMQWNAFSRTQLDSCTGHPISAQRFWKATAWDPATLRDQWVLDVGCGAGRFAEVALAAGARVVALDFSSAVDACYTNLGPHPRLHVIQGNIYKLPLPRATFPFVYCLGVLQHTPDVRKAFHALPPMLLAGAAGKLCVDYYERSLKALLQPKYVLRPLTKRMNREVLFRTLQRCLPMLLATSNAVGRVPKVGRLLRRVVPVANYRGILPLDDQRLAEWALLDTFDWLSPQYDNPQSSSTVRRWLTEAGMTDIEVLKAGHLVGRGRSPSAVPAGPKDA